MSPEPSGGTRRSAGARRRGPERLVVGYDGSPAAAAGLRWAAEHSGGEGSLIVVVHARRAGGATLTAGVAAARARAGLEDLWLHEGELLNGTELELRLVEEPPATALCRTASEIGADGIVVGRHERGTFAADVVRELLRRTSLPVTIVPAPSRRRL